VSDPNEQRLDTDVAPTADPDGVSPSAASEAMETDIAQLMAEKDEFRELAQRVQADFENYRKRMLREQTEKIERASESIVEQLLPVLDNFELALPSLDSADEKVRKGVELLYTELVGVLAKAGLEPIDAQGKPFDPNEHEAVAQEDGDGEPVVCDVLRAGYRLKGRVLRPATVRVTRAANGA
jgi:molecular chaperone GrpE